MALLVLGVVAAFAAVAASAPGPLASAAHRDMATGSGLPPRTVGGWTRVFADDFPTNVPLGRFSRCSGAGVPLMQARCSGLPASVARKWYAYPDGWTDTSGRGRYSPARVISVRDGVMNLHLHTETLNGRAVHMVAAPLPKIPGGVKDFGLRYGRYAVRFRADPLPGYKAAFLLWPDDDRLWQSSETDFPEGDLDDEIAAFAHYTSDGDARQHGYPTGEDFDAWHTAVIEWTPAGRKFFLDGKLIGTSPRSPSNPLHWVLQTETALGGPGPADDVAGDVQIDWVAAYRMNP